MRAFLTVALSLALFTLGCGDGQVRVYPRYADRAILLIVKPGASQPAAKEASQLVARDVFVVGVHPPDLGEARVAAHAIEKCVDQFEDPFLTTGRVKRGITNAEIVL